MSGFAKVNVINLTLVHDVGAGCITCTATSPYIAEINDPIIVTARNLLQKYFAEISAPPAKDAPSLLWGEWTEGPDEVAPAEVLAPGEKPKLYLP